MISKVCAVAAFEGPRYFLFLHGMSSFSLQCCDIVGWMTGRASGL